jgi:NADH-quinone oxidoreductase subunit H
MLLGIGFKVILVATVLLGVLVPIRALAIRSAPLQAGTGVFSNHPVVGLIAPLAWLLDLLVERSSAPDRRFALFAAISIFVAPLTAFALIPFGSQYRLGEHEISLVIANLDFGILWLLFAMMLARFGAIGLVRQPARRAPLAIVGATYALGAGLALAAVAMVFETLSPISVVVAQDRNLAMADFVGPALPALQRLQLPGWGMFFQPISLLLFVFCALGASRTASPIEPESHPGGAEQIMIRAANHLDHLLIAGVVVVLFLGGSALPYLSGDAIIDMISQFYGVGFATILCMAIHAVVFVTKLLLVTVALEPLRTQLDGISFESALNRCWKGIIPLALINLFVTAQVLIAGGAP